MKMKNMANLCISYLVLYFNHAVTLLYVLHLDVLRRQKLKLLLDNRYIYSTTILCDIVLVNQDKEQAHFSVYFVYIHKGFYLCFALFLMYVCRILDPEWAYE